MAPPLEVLLERQKELLKQLEAQYDEYTKSKVRKETYLRSILKNANVIWLEFEKNDGVLVARQEEIMDTKYFETHKDAENFYQSLNNRIKSNLQKLEDGKKVTTGIPKKVTASTSAESNEDKEVKEMAAWLESKLKRLYLSINRAKSSS